MAATVKMDRSMCPGTIFERNRRKTIVAVVLLSILAIDLIAGLLLIPGDDLNFRRADPYFHHGLIPNRSGVSKWGNAEYSVYTNSLGFLDERVRDVPIEPGKERVVFIGDSFTEGLGVPHERTFVGLLSQRVDHERLEILNAGVLSYCPKLYYLKTKYLLENVGLRFDELYVFIDISDIQDEVLYEKFAPMAPSFLDRARSSIQGLLGRNSFSYFTVDRWIASEKREQRKRKYTAKIYPPWLDYFWLEDQNLEAASSPGFAFVRDRWTFDRGIYDNPSTQAGIKLAEAHMQKLVDMCRQHEIDVTIAVYPWMPQVASRLPSDAQVRLWGKFSMRNELRFIDLYPIFVNDQSPHEIYETYFIQGDMHWNEKGHQAVADMVLVHLAESHPDAILER